MFILFPPLLLLLLLLFFFVVVVIILFFSEAWTRGNLLYRINNCLPRLTPTRPGGRWFSPRGFFKALYLLWKGLFMRFFFLFRLSKYPSVIGPNGRPVNWFNINRGLAPTTRIKTCISSSFESFNDLCVVLSLLLGTHRHSHWGSWMISSRKTD